MRPERRRKSPASLSSEVYVLAPGQNKSDMSRPERKRRSPALLSSKVYVLPGKQNNSQNKNEDPKKQKEARATVGLKRKRKHPVDNSQVENVAPGEKTETYLRPKRNKRSPLRTSSKVYVLASKLHPSKDGNTSKNKKTIVSKKSPVLQDRTNTSLDLTKDEPLTLKYDEIPKQNSKKSNEKLKKRHPTDKIAIENQAVASKGRSKTLITNSKSASLKNESKIFTTLKGKSTKFTDIKQSDKNEDKNENEVSLQIKIVEDSVKNIENSKEMIKPEVPKRNLRSAASRENSVGNVKENTGLVKKNKFFKSRTGEPGTSRISPAKKKKVVKKVNCMNSFRQMKLTDSYSIMTTSKRLRPRREVKNYLEKTETSILVGKHISPEKRNSIVCLEKMDRVNKEPVYKSVKLSENPVKDSNEIYDFNFDANDPTEKLTNRRKRRVLKKPTLKRVKKIPLAKPTSEGSKGKVDEAVPAEVLKETEIPKIVVDRVISPVNDDIDDAPNHDNIDYAPNHDNIENVKQPPILKDSVLKKVALPLTENARNIVTMPRVIDTQILRSVQKVDVVSHLAVSRQTAGTFNPFRSTNAFKSRPTIQHKDMKDHSLLNKSFSPIKNIIDDFNPASPWRPPALSTFSHIKQVVQSTPHMKNHSSTFGRSILGADLNRKTSTLGQKKNEILEENDENSDVNIQKVQRKIEGPLALKTIKVAPSIKNALQDNNIPYLNVNRKELENPQPKADMTNDTLDFTAFDDYAENQENTVPNSQSLKKSPTKNANHRAVGRLPGLHEKQPTALQKKEFNPIPEIQKEDFEPMPGPSGLQRSYNFNESRILKQSNLNNYLNLEEMPESTRINTAHGIFGDAHSTPIRNRPSRKVLTEDNIENAFGFDEGESEIEASPILLNEKPVIPLREIFRDVRRKINDSQRLKVKSSSNPIRLSVGEIKKTLLPEVLKKKNVQMENLQRIQGKQQNEVKDAVNFSDTFDVLSEKAQLTIEDDTSQLPLFADLEPLHFKKPPRHSYVRKRPPKRSFSEDEEEDEDNEEKEQKKPKAKKKVSKLSKQDEKRINDWAKSLNDTFQEIDNFDLVVEKFS